MIRRPSAPALFLHALLLSALVLATRPAPATPDAGRDDAPAAAGDPNSDWHEARPGAGDVASAPRVGGPIGSAAREVTGALTGRIVYCSGGHGRTWSGTAWGWQRSIEPAGGGEILEDLGNVDQLMFFADYCLNAGATVVPFRPIGFQDAEVVLDNDDAGVVFSGSWGNSSSTIFFGSPGDAVPYRFASVVTGATPTATATYTATLPASGFYPVYVWARPGSDRVSQQYVVTHSGGSTTRRVQHRRVGQGWIYLGTFYFEAAGPSAVQITNLADPADTLPGSPVVIADAVRFGNGLGDVDRGGGVSGFARQDEASRYWVQQGLGQGTTTTVYDGGGDDQSDNVGAPPRMAATMNRETDGPATARVFVGFHSNASGGRGADGLFCSDASTQTPNANCTTNQYAFAAMIGREVNEDLRAMTTAAGNPFEVAWTLRGASDSSHRFGSGGAGINSYGEISESAASFGSGVEEFDATIIEVAYHDDLDDAKLLSDPKVRDAIGAACYQAVVKYFATFGGGTLAILPDPPAAPSAASDALGQVTLRWTPPVAGGPFGVGGDAPTGYVVYVSTNGFGFGQPQLVAGGAASSLDVTALVPLGATRYFRIAATNAGGESMPSPTVGVRRRAGRPPILVVDGFDRFDRPSMPLQTLGANPLYRHNLRRLNRFDYVVDVGRAIDANGFSFDSASNERVASGSVALGNYHTVFWILGEESTADETFSAAEQTVVTSYLAAGGNLFVSGAELAWDLDRPSGPAAGDRTFLHAALHATYAGDDAATYAIAAPATGLFAGIGGFAFDDGTAGNYDTAFPDRLTPSGAGTTAVLAYSGGTADTAAVAYDGSAGGGRVVVVGFPFETITSSATRTAIVGRVLAFFATPIPVELAAFALE